MIFESDEDEFGSESMRQVASLFFGGEIRTRTENEIYTVG